MLTIGDFIKLLFHNIKRITIDMCLAISFTYEPNKNQTEGSQKKSREKSLLIINKVSKKKR